METFDSLEQPMCDYTDSMDALPELWGSDSFVPSSMAVDLQENDNYQQTGWPTGLTFSLMSASDDSNDALSSVGSSAMIVLHDRLITDASMPVSKTLAISTSITTDRLQPNSSSLLTCPDSSLVDSKQTNSVYNISLDSQCEVDISEDPKSNKDPCYDSLSIKTEPASPGSTFALQTVKTDTLFEYPSRKRCNSSSSNQICRERQNIKAKPVTGNNRLVLTRVSASSSNKSASFVLPPTPPSSTSSDSEGSLSPERDTISPKLEAGDEARARRIVQASRVLLTSKPLSDPFNSGSNRHPINSPLISYQPKGSTGVLQLTEEEKRTLLAEGYSVPTRLPLTKAEEKSLKKIRRKIKNKISAQESRRKKKEYMDTLERRAQILADENTEYRQRLHKLETDNAALQLQLTRLKQFFSQQSSNSDPDSHQIDELYASKKSVTVSRPEANPLKDISVEMNLSSQSVL